MHSCTMHRQAQTLRDSEILSLTLTLTLTCINACSVCASVCIPRVPGKDPSHTAENSYKPNHLGGNI